MVETKEEICMPFFSAGSESEAEADWDLSEEEEKEDETVESKGGKEEKAGSAGMLEERGVGLKSRRSGGAGGGGGPWGEELGGQEEEQASTPTGAGRGGGGSTFIQYDLIMQQLIAHDRNNPTASRSSLCESLAFFSSSRKL